MIVRKQHPLNITGGNKIITVGTAVWLKDKDNMTCNGLPVKLVAREIITENYPGPHFFSMYYRYYIIFDDGFDNLRLIKTLKSLNKNKSSFKIQIQRK